MAALHTESVGDCTFCTRGENWATKDPIGEDSPKRPFSGADNVNFCIKPSVQEKCQILNCTDHLNEFAVG